MMQSRFLSVCSLAFALCGIGTVQAQTARYISTSGNDANACTRSAPCLTLQRGVDTISSSGIVQALSAGSYGSAKIERDITVTISGEGMAAAIGRITVNASGAKVTLRRLL